MEETHRCTKCGMERPIERFHWDRTRNRPQNWCRDCKNAGRRKDGCHPRNTAESEEDKYHKIRGKYGLSRSAHDALEAEHAGRCAICGGPPVSGRSRLDVDHDHASGIVRGLLCSNCNRALGLMADDPDRLDAAAHYLRSRSNG